MSESRGFFLWAPESAEELESTFSPAIAARVYARLTERRAAAAAAIARAEADAIAELSTYSAVVLADYDRADVGGVDQVLTAEQAAELTAALPELRRAAEEAEEYARRAARGAADAAEESDRRGGPLLAGAAAAYASMVRAL